MKVYFILRDYFNDARFSRSSRITLQTFIIDGVETVTNDFLIDSINAPSLNLLPAYAYDYCLANQNGSNPVPSSTNPNSYNPFAYDFRLIYPASGASVNGRGLPTATANGNNYGAGVMSFGVDKPTINTAEGLVNGAFFLEVDLAKAFFTKFSIMSNVVNGQVFSQPQTVREYTIEWNPEGCKKSFTYINVLNNQFVDDLGFGFLSGALKADLDPFLDLSGLNCGGGTADPKCEDKERTRSKALFVQMPTETESPDEIFKECCYSHYVLADTENSSDYRNDYSGFWHQRQLPNETATFTLVRTNDGTETVLNDDAGFGQFFPFGYFETNTNLTGYKIEWRRVLQELGEGSYVIRKNQMIAGQNIVVNSYTHNLKRFSTKIAKQTVRMDVVMNGRIEKLGVQFKGTGWKHSLRFGGMFGRREPQHEEDILIERNYKKTQISMKQTNEYKFGTMLLPICITSEIFDFMIFANDIFMNDYNLNNHSYGYVKFPVKYTSNDGTYYSHLTRNARLNLVFEDRLADTEKRNYI